MCSVDSVCYFTAENCCKKSSTVSPIGESILPIGHLGRRGHREKYFLRIPHLRKVEPKVTLLDH